MSLCDKYAPYTLNAIVGNDTAKQRLISFSAEANEGKRIKPIMICGPSGIGKTAAAHAIAYANGFDLVELNASDYRNADNLKKKILPLSTTRGLFSKKSIILFDEIDELSSRFDTGCEATVTKLIKESRHPVIFIANDYWGRKISFLRAAVEKVEFKRPEQREVLSLLERVALREGKQVSHEVLEEIANRSNGDIRGALNDLEMMLGADPELLDYLGMRDRKAEVFKVLDKIFLSSNFDIARNAMMSSDVELDMMINWVGQNISNKYLSKVSIYEAYENLSRASMFNEKASRRSYYGYLRYASVLMSAGVALASNGNVSMINQYAFPSRIRQLSKTKKGRDEIASIALKFTTTFHANKRTIIGEHLPVMSLMINKGIGIYGEEKVLDFMAMHYWLDKEEVETIAAYSRVSF